MCRVPDCAAQRMHCCLNCHMWGASGVRRAAHAAARLPRSPCADHAATGKSTVAQQLAARINVPNVMQTDVLCDLLRARGAPGLGAAPLWARGDAACSAAGSSGGGDGALLAEFRRECRVVRRAMQGDLVKVRRRGP